MLTKFVRSADGTTLSVRIEGDASAVAILSISPWAGGGRTADMLGVDPFGPARQERFWISFDPRGTGGSARDVRDVSVAAQVHDIEAVVEALGLDQFDVNAFFDASIAAIAFAARHPEHVRRMMLWQPFAIGEDYLPKERVDGLIELARRDWQLAIRTFGTIMAPRAPSDIQRTLAGQLRDRINVEQFVAYLTSIASADVRKEAAEVASPTLVLHPRGSGVPAGPPQRVASLIPNAAFHELDQQFAFNTDPAVGRMIIAFLDGKTAYEDAMREQRSASSTAVIMFTDIVDSTSLTERLGDAGFRERSYALDAGLRAAIRDAGGAAVEGKLLGDGVLATFGSAAQAIDGARRCLALSVASELGLHIGVHAGDVIREENNVFGGAVNIAARICALSAPGEILVSDVVRGMARTSAGVTFEDRSEQEMKGVGDPVRVYAVRWRDSNAP